MSVDIPAVVVDEVEEMQERECIAWRVSCRRAREQAKEREGAEEGAEKQGMGDQNVQPDSIRFRKIFVQHRRKG